MSIAVGIIIVAILLLAFFAFLKHSKRGVHWGDVKKAIDKTHKAAQEAKTAQDTADAAAEIADATGNPADIAKAEQAQTVADILAVDASNAAINAANLHAAVAAENTVALAQAQNNLYTAVATGAVSEASASSQSAALSNVAATNAAADSAASAVINSPTFAALINAQSTDDVVAAATVMPASIPAPVANTIAAAAPSLTSTIASAVTKPPTTVPADIPAIVAAPPSVQTSNSPVMVSSSVPIVQTPVPTTLPPVALPATSVVTAAELTASAPPEPKSIISTITSLFSSNTPAPSPPAPIISPPVAVNVPVAAVAPTTSVAIANPSTGTLLTSVPVVVPKPVIAPVGISPPVNVPTPVIAPKPVIVSSPVGISPPVVAPKPVVAPAPVIAPKPVIVSPPVVPVKVTPPVATPNWQPAKAGYVCEGASCKSVLAGKSAPAGMKFLESGALAWTEKPKKLNSSYFTRGDCDDGYTPVFFDPETGDFDSDYGATACIKCPSGTFLSSTGDCVKTAPKGYAGVNPFSDLTAKQKDAGISVSSKLPKSWTKKGDKDINVDTMPGSYGKVSCPKGSSVASMGKVSRCITKPCPTGMALQNATCYPQCPPGSVFKDGNCSILPIYTRGTL